MIAEKTLRKWRRDALTSTDTQTLDVIAAGGSISKGLLSHYQEAQERILRLTQELMDAHLMRKG
jgi:hypothetical protein